MGLIETHDNRCERWCSTHVSCLKPRIAEKRAARQPVSVVSSGGDGAGSSTSGDTTPSLEADFAALRKLRDESECDELKPGVVQRRTSASGDASMKASSSLCFMVEDGRVANARAVLLEPRWKLPGAIGELKAAQGSRTYVARLSPRCRPRSASSKR